MNFDSIAGRTFSTVKKGWNPEEVRLYMQQLAQDLSGLYDENNALRMEIVKLETRLKQSHAVETRVSNVLDDVRKASRKLIGQAEENAASLSVQVHNERRDILRKARAEADLVLRDAEKTAERIMMQGNEKLNVLNEQIDLLQTRKMALITRIKSILRAQVDFLGAMERQGDSQFRVSNPLKDAAKTREGIGADELSFIIDKLDQLENT